MSASFDRMTTVTASTLRPPAVANGKRGAATVNITSLKCMPLDPVANDLAEKAPFAVIAEHKQTMVRGGLDIQAGDQLVVGSKNYAIRFVADWYWPREASGTLALIVEELK